MAYEQQAPFAIQVELTEGCNLGCSFCGLQGIRKDGTKPWKYMERDTALRIANEVTRVGWNSRFIFSMHGEPTLNPNATKIIQAFRKRIPTAKIAIMTNGFGLVHDIALPGGKFTPTAVIGKIEEFRRAGVNDLIVDAYAPKGDAYWIQKALAKTANDYKVCDLDDKGVPLYSNTHKGFRILFTPPIQNTPAINRHLCNHCGAAGPLDLGWNTKRCARPFRELAFRYDGNVALCCNDFRGEYPIANIMDMPIDNLWQHKRFQAARRYLYHGRREFKPCYGCNALSHRVGLLPDLLGKDTLRKPTEKDEQIVNTSSKPLTKIYRRVWENDED